MFFGMMFFWWLPFLLLFFFVVAVRGVFRAFGVFRKHGTTDRIGGRPIHDQFHSLYFGEFGMPPDGRQSLENKIFRLASRRRGQVTISDVVVETDLGVAAAESFMDHLVDGSRVRMEVTDEGIVVYEFPELMHRDS